MGHFAFVFTLNSLQRKIALVGSTNCLPIAEYPTASLFTAIDAINAVISWKLIYKCECCRYNRLFLAEPS